MKKNLFKKNQKSLKRRLSLFRLGFFSRLIQVDTALDMLVKLRALFVLLLSSHQRFRFANTTHFRNQCLLTWRVGSYYSFFRLTRITLRERFSFGLLKGIRKSSW